MFHRERGIRDGSWGMSRSLKGIAGARHHAGSIHLITEPHGLPGKWVLIPCSRQERRPEVRMLPGVTRESGLKP